MADDDEVGDATPFDPTFATAGPRRSTFTPPPASAQRPVVSQSDSDGVDDDALADALAASLGRPVSAPSADAAPPPAPERPAAPVDPAPYEPAADTTPTPVYQPSPPVASPPPPVAPAWSTLPAPDPAQAVPLPDGPPVRRSLPDEKLAEWVDSAEQQPGGTLDIIEQLETQVRLREEEVREFRAWEDRMRSLGTPDALAAVDDARSEFIDVLPEASAAPKTGSFVLPEQPVAQWPPTPEPVVPDSPTSDSSPGEAPTAEPVPVAPPLPTWGVPAPSATWSPDPEVPASPEEPVEPEPEAAEPEPAEPQAPGQPDPSGDPEPLDVPEPPAAPESPTAPPSPMEPDRPLDPTPGAPELPVEPEPFAVRLPFQQDPDSPFRQPAVDDDTVLEPTIEPDTGPTAQVTGQPVEEPELTIEPEPEPEPDSDPDTGTDTGIPPLIEPPPIGRPFAPPADASTRPFDFSAGAPTPPAGPIPTFTFDDLLSGSDEVAPAADDATRDAPAQVLFVEPVPLSAGDPIPTDTGSVSVIDQAYEEDLDDDVDETDRVAPGLGPVAVDTAGVALLGAQPYPPSGPIPTARIPDDESVLFDDEPVKMKVFSLETTGLEATPVDHRVGRAARLFWLWFATNSSILSLGLGATVFAVGLSLRQSVVAVLAGVALSFIPLGLTTLAGKRSGQPTMVVSRATFGLIGNALPALLALVTRLFWGAVLLWLLASSILVVLVGAQLDGSLGERQLLLISLAGAFLVALLVAFAGYPLFARLQLILSIVSGVLVVGLIVLTAEYIDLPAALTTPDGPWVLTITGAVLVFSFVGLVWAHSGADLARYQRPGSSGASSMLWATFGTTLPTFLLIGYGALLAASDSSIARGFLLSPLDTLALMLPVWYPVPLIAATTLSLLSGITLSLYSGGFALQSLGVRVSRQWSIVIVGVLLAGIALLLAFGVTGGINDVFRDVATTLAVPTAAWAGIFAAETMIRNRRYESESLVRRGGVYGDVRWVNLIALILVTGVGYGLTTATVSWLGWQGYGFPLLGLPLDGDLAGTDLGVLVALGLGLLVPIVAGIPAIRKQEAARP